MYQSINFRKIHSATLRAAGNGREALRLLKKSGSLANRSGSLRFTAWYSTVGTTFRRRRRINHPRAGAAFTRKGRHQRTGARAGATGQRNKNKKG